VLGRPAVGVDAVEDVPGVVVDCAERADHAKTLVARRLDAARALVERPLDQHPTRLTANSVHTARHIFIDRVAGEIIRLVASVCVRVCVSVRLFVGALLFEPFDL